MKTPRLTVKSKLIATFSTILVVPMLLLGLLSYQSAKTELSNELLTTASENVRLVDALLNRTLMEQSRNVGWIAADIVRKDIQEENRVITKKKLQRFLALNSEVSEAYIGDENGGMMTATDSKLPDGFDPRKRDWYIAAMKQPGKTIIVDPYIDAITGKVVVGMAMALPDQSGVYGIDIQLSALDATVKQAKIGTQGFMTILDKNRKMLVNPNGESGVEVAESWVDTVYAKESGRLQFQHEGNPVQAVFTTNENTGWKLVGVMYESEAGEAANPIFYTMLVIIIAALVVAGGIIYVILRSLLRPLRMLTEAAEKMSQGDVTQQVHIRSDDELGTLGKAFNHMAESLRSLLHSVNDSVQQLASSAEQLSASADQTSKATEQIAETMQEMAEGTEQQVSHTQEGNAAVEQMSARLGQIAEHTQNVFIAARESSDLAVTGNKAIQSAVLQMNASSKSIHGLAKVVDNLGTRSQEIGNIVDVITAIANQTNLLALNAAIEAARAGEYGRGFAVVADEVRKLAEQSASSAQQINQLITAIQTETNHAVLVMDQSKREVTEGIEKVNEAGQSFEQIQSAVNEVADKIGQVSEATRDFSTRAQQVVEIIGHISEVTLQASDGTQSVSAAAQEQLASMEEIASSAVSLEHLAEELQNQIGQFRI